MVETIPEYLARMRRKDREKHGFDGGWKTTAEVAEFFGITTASARRKLHGLRADNQIDSAWDGNLLVWRALA
jgi:hypothetical protein